MEAVLLFLNAPICRDNNLLNFCNAFLLLTQTIVWFLNFAPCYGLYNNKAII